MAIVHMFSPHLKDLTGHEFQYSKIVSEYFVLQGHKVKIYGVQTKDLKVLDLKCFYPLFNNFNFSIDRGSRFTSLFRYYLSFSSKLNTILNLLSFYPGDIIFAHTVLHYEFPIWIWNLIRVRKKLPRVVLLLRYSPNLTFRNSLQTRVLSCIYRLFFYLSRKIQKIVFATDSEQLVSEYIRLSAPKLKVLPIPLEQTFSCLKPKLNIGKKNDSYHLVYLGHAHLGKGFDLLPKLVLDLKNEFNEKVSFTIHCGRSIDEDSEPKIYDSFMALKNLSEKGMISFIEGNIPREYYLRLLFSADIVILPCRRKYYATQTSNVFTEALAAEKPVIVPEGTWMSERIIRVGGGVLFESGNPQSLSFSLKELIRNYKRYKEESKIQSSEWRSFHSVEKLAKGLFYD